MRVSRPIGAGGIADRGAGVHVVQPSGAPHGRLPPIRSEASSPTRRDTRFLPPPNVQRRPTACCRRAISPGKPRSIAVPRDTGLLHVKAPDRALGAVFQAGCSRNAKQMRNDHESDRRRARQTARQSLCTVCY
jgi:hypothetical protein